MIVVSSPESAFEALRSNNRVVLFTGDPVEGSAEAMNIKEMCYVRLTTEGQRMIANHGVSNADARGQILCVPKENDQVQFVGPVGGGFQTSVAHGGLIESVHPLVPHRGVRKGGGR